MENKLLPLFNIAFEIEKNIAESGWLPSEKDIDDDCFTKDDYDYCTEEYKKLNENVIFSNTHLNYDSCDCGDGYGCSHGSWVYEISVSDQKEKIVSISVEDEDQLCIGEHHINTKNLSVGLFYLLCLNQDIKLEFTEYGTSLLTTKQD